MQKIIKTKMAGVISQVVKCLPRKYEVLNSNPMTTKKKKENS
jgi:hypothetical protein